MRDWTGYIVSDIGDPALRNKLAAITYYLSDLSKAMGRLSKSQLPDGSGDSILGPDDGFYFKLKGRPGGQWAHGDTGPGGTLTLSSTLASTKGSIFLGDAHASVYDEVNERIGLGQPVPAAKLHVKIGTATQPTARPSSSGTNSIAWGVTGAASFWDAVNDIGDDLAGTDYFSWTANLGYGGYVTLDLNNLVNTPTPPGTLSGFKIRVTMRQSLSAGLIPNSVMDMQMAHNGNSAIITDGIAGTVGWRFGIAGGAPCDQVTTSSFVTYEKTLTNAACAALNFAEQWGITFNYGGLTSGGSGTWDISKVEVVIPSGSTIGSDILHKWENPTTSNALEYAADGAGTTTLQLSGTPPLRLTTAPEFAVGAPAANKLWAAADAEGTGQWLAASAAVSAYASALPTKMPYSWEANGPYRAGAEVDGARTVPRAMTLLTARMYRKTAGAAGSTQVDVLKNGSTTMLAAPITIGAVSGNAVTASAALIATPTLVAGDWLSCSAVAVETGMPVDWAVVVEGY